MTMKLVWSSDHWPIGVLAMTTLDRCSLLKVLCFTSTLAIFLHSLLSLSLTRITPLVIRAQRRINHEENDFVLLIPWKEWLHPRAQYLLVPCCLQPISGLSSPSKKFQVNFQHAFCKMFFDTTLQDMFAWFEWTVNSCLIEPQNVSWKL